jgi:2-polyprenyl-6-methoxyphenol hydroxylase-like FAD-dependent oxidoreductase
MLDRPALRSAGGQNGSVTSAGDVLVIGASFAGLFSAAAAQRAGAHVTVLERDELSDDAAERPGVPQGGQPHVLLHRGLVATQQLLPGLREELLAAGGVPLDTGDIPWLSPDGWLPTGVSAFEIVSLSRPLLELLVRRRVLALDGVELRTGVRVRGLSRAGDRWQVTCDDGACHVADTVIDASGRSSRLPRWLAGLGISTPEPAVVEAKLGYATRRYRASRPLPLDTGVVVAATPETSAGALALPVEDDQWLVCGAGYGERRPDRDTDAFDRYLRSLSDPALADLIQLLEPVDEVRIHRQTANRRHRYDRVRRWPGGLLVVGDALTAFNPLYGQGITVAACQAQLLSRSLGRRLDRRATRRVQAELAQIADFPWAVATGEDVRYPSCSERQTLGQRLSHVWSQRVNQLAVGGNITCRRTLGGIYHMMVPAIMLFSPRIVGPVLVSLIRGVPPQGPRPAALTAIDGRSQLPARGAGSSAGGHEADASPGPPVSPQPGL